MNIDTVQYDLVSGVGVKTMPVRNKTAAIAGAPSIGPHHNTSVQPNDMIVGSIAYVKCSSSVRGTNWYTYDPQSPLPTNNVFRNSGPNYPTILETTGTIFIYTKK